MNLDHIPDILKALPQWVCWGYEERDGEETKPPKSPVTGKNAKSNDPSTWGSFDQALEHYRTHSNNGIAGIGYQLGVKPSGLVGIDLDHCISEPGTIEPWAASIVERINSYTETSPSGKGLRIFVIGMLPPGGRKKGNFEVYDSGRYMTVTGQHVEGTPTSILDRSGEVVALHKEIFGDKEPKPPKQEPREPVQQDDEWILEKARAAKNGAKFDRLWAGDWSEYGSQSEGDSGLIFLLAFYSKDEVQLDRLFRQSGLYREKWDKRHHSSGMTYGEETVRRALELVTETYSAPQEAREDDFPDDDAQEPDTTPTVAHRGKKAEKAEDIPLVPFPEDIMRGVAGDFAALYSRYFESPAHFFYCAFMTALGVMTAKRVRLNTSVGKEPRLYTLLLGESADDRKSTAIDQTVSFFKSTYHDEFNACYGVGSAEGLAKHLQEHPDLLLCLDEFSQFVGKTRADGSVLLQAVTSLFEGTSYQNRTSKDSIDIQNVSLAMLAASTKDTFDRTWDSRFTSIGFNNRLFLVPGRGIRRFAFPEPIPETERQNLKAGLFGIFRHIGTEGLLLGMTPEAKEIYEAWYMGLEGQGVHARRLDTYSLRFMGLMAANELKSEIDTDLVQRVGRLMDWQLQVRRLLDPIDADNAIATMEERIRRVLQPGPRKERELKQITHASRAGLWAFSAALQNLKAAGEVVYDKGENTWAQVD